ncbi:SdrD B-like domain-containing protein [Dyadobacter sp. CY312]|uniref:SdrD B-like domain-containing protein n=1 Tax=Dyadobacter sp. CY312 TaxID=2907303 RepID=UPI001F367D99|nr:SdrD B-like domain-containing protein [Dyadobacter sp. CY312]MCE7039130.1 T9SS type A sorting domain-containing protein [Dyadobacter sp. CY312]
MNQKTFTFLLLTGLLAAISISFKSAAQTCTITVSTDNVTVNTTGAADIICITASVINTTFNNLGAGDVINVASGVTWTMPSDLNYNSLVTYNIEVGATVNTNTAGSNGNLVINNSGTLNFTNNFGVTFVANGNSTLEINNKAGGILNHLTGTGFKFGARSDFTNEGTMNFNNLEVAEASNPTNSATGVLNIKRNFDLHSLGWLNAGKVSTTCETTGIPGADSQPCSFMIGDKGAFSAVFADGSCTSINGPVIINCPTNISGYFENDNGDFTINKLVSGLGGTIVVKNGISSTSGDGGINNATLEFYDVNTRMGVGPTGAAVAHGLDQNSGNPSDAFAVPSIQPGNSCELASIGDRVWKDNGPGTNLNNGIQDDGEAGVAGVTVELLDGNGNSIDRDPITSGMQQTVIITDQDGNYLFNDLTPGPYKIKFSNLPSGFVLSLSKSGSDDAKNSDGEPLLNGASTTHVYTLTAGQTNLSADLGIVDGMALPVTLIHFKVLFENSSVQLTWSTSQESNSRDFEVERSADARSWNQIGVVPASGNKNGLTNYNLTDVSPSADINYYRLKMVDLDGKFAYSSIRNIHVKEGQKAVSYVFPNPTSDKLFIASDYASGIKSVLIYYSNGKLALNAGEVVGNEININALPAGKYLVRLIYKDKTMKVSQILVTR